MRKPNKNSRKSYKGPYQKNPELELHNVKKTMRTDTDGPTIDGFSDIDSTTSFNSSDDTKATTKGPKRPTRERKKKNYFTTENIIIGILTIVASGVGIIVFNHSNKFVSVEKDIEHVNEKIKDQSETLKDQGTKIDNTNQKINSIDNKIDLLNQKIDLKSTKK